MRFWRPITVALTVLALVACDRQVARVDGAEHAPSNRTEADAGKTAQAKLLERAKKLEPLTDPAGALTLKPGGIDRCKTSDGPVSIEVSWNATAFGTEGVHVFLQNPNEERKLWSSAGAVGSERTGEWMQDGSMVILVNAANGMDIANLTMRDVACD